MCWVIVFHHGDMKLSLSWQKFVSILQPEAAEPECLQTPKMKIKCGHKTPVGQFDCWWTLKKGSIDPTVSVCPIENFARPRFSVVLWAHLVPWGTRTLPEDVCVPDSSHHTWLNSSLSSLWTCFTHLDFPSRRASTEAAAFLCSPRLCGPVPPLCGVKGPEIDGRTERPPFKLLSMLHLSPAGDLGRGCITSVIKHNINTCWSEHVLLCVCAARYNPNLLYSHSTLKLLQRSNRCQVKYSRSAWCFLHYHDR